ncbi:MAG: hypothetical protein IRZ29_04460 [Thermoflavifilum sp.]|nr:hypothetical protein [Thermoflavifilum sp.]
MMLKRLSSWLPYLAVMMIGTCLYWPVMTGLFFLKNDAAVAYFPVRLQMSEAIHQGIIPFWSPYINYGYPLHADFSSGFWNPVVWLCISLFHYRFYTLHLEWMMYVWMGGWGMFRLGKALHFSDAVACAVATAYLGSGYWLGSAEWMNWISPLAWLPWLLALGLLLFRHQRLSHALWLAIVLWCYLSNAHPDQIIWLMYFTAISLLAGWIAYRKSWQQHIPNHAAARHLIKLLLIAALCTGLLLAGS